MAKEEEKDPEDTSKSSKRKKKRKLSWLREDPAGKAVHVSAAGAQAAGTAGGEGLATIGRAAPALQVAAVAYDAYQIGRNVEKDRRRGTSRNTVKKVTTTVSAYGGGIGGAVAGATIGTALFPGVGTIVGGIVGGLTGGIGSAIGSGKAAEVIMDKAEYDSKRKVCRKCQKTFLWRKYEEDEDLGAEEREICDECRENSNEKEKKSV